MTPEERANAAALGRGPASPPVTRRLSWWRLAGVLVVALAAGSAVVAFRSGAQPASAAPPDESFAPYVDVTATPSYAFEDPTVSTSNNVVLGFIVGSTTPSAGCTASWGGVYSLAAASDQLDLDRRIARVQQRGGEVSVSFGGADNDELALSCPDATQLAAAYQSVITRYALTSIDLDIETAAASDPAVDARRAAALAAVQAQQAHAGHPLAVWLTLPIAPTGLTARGLAVLRALLQARVDLAGVNALAMDYSQSAPTAVTMAATSELALGSLNRQLIDSYRAAGTVLTADAAWQKISATAMIGQNDLTDERFELSDAQELVAFAKLHHLARLSMWSANRDQECGINYANPEVVSDDCSGVNQQPGAFSAIFETFSTPATAPSGKQPRTSTPTSVNPNAMAASPTAQTTDNPAASPYPIWNPVGAYAKGTKIVWHHNVYEAKWWTQGDLPDAPVNDADDTPWTLIGPVLPGEHPAPLPTLPSGTYPQWSAQHVYQDGDRVLYNGSGYQAKWWNQGQVPAPDPLQPADTPWQLITS